MAQETKRTPETEPATQPSGDNEILQAVKEAAAFDTAPGLTLTLDGRRPDEYLRCDA